MKLCIKRMNRTGIVVALVVALFLGGLFNPMTVQASSPSDDVYRMMDSLLNSTGLSANYSYVNRMVATLANIVRGTGQSYKNYCKENQFEENQESWQSYVNSEAYLDNSVPFADTFATAFGVTLFGADLIEWLIDYNEEDLANLSDEDAARLVLTDGEPVVKGGSYTISDETVEATRAVFDAMFESDGLGYYYINTMSPANVKPSWFVSPEDYNNFKNYIKSSDNVTFIRFQTKGKDPIDTDVNITFYPCNNSIIYYPVLPLKTLKSSNIQKMYLYNSDWTKAGPNLPVNRNGDGYFSIYDKTSYEEAYALGNNMPHDSLYNYLSGYSSQSGNANWYGLFSKDGRKQIVFESLGALQNYLGGYREVFTDITYDYSTSNDNSVKFSGSYMVDDSYSYSHDQIVNNIDNSTETVDESVVNNIVGDTINNITNNYYTESSGSGGSGSGSNNDNGSSGSTDNGATIWDGLTTLVSGIGDILNFIVTLIGEILTLLANLLTQIMELLGEFKDVSGEFVYFVADFFVFVPEEIWNVIALGLTSIIGIALWKAFKS